MRIEEIDKIKLSKACDKELLILKLRFTQLFDKNFRGSNSVVVGSLNRNKFLKNYKLLLDEMNSRAIEKSTSSIDKALFKKVMTTRKYGIDVSDFKDTIVVSDCIVVDASEVSFEKITAVIKSKLAEFSDVSEQSQNIDGAYFPLYDLVLKAKPETILIEVSKPYPNEHSARLQDPDKFDPKSYRRTRGGILYGSKKVPSTISIIWGKLKGKAKPSDPPIAQALRFPTKDWTVTKAKKWLSDNNITFISFEPATKLAKKIWSARYINRLPDSAFLYIEPGGEKDDEDKTKPRTLRHFPYKDSTGKIDLPHLRNALARIPQSKLPKTVKDKISAKAKKILEDIKEGGDVQKFEEKEEVPEKFVQIYPVDKADNDEHIVCGIVYEPDIVDAQGDKANEAEIRKAAYQFIENIQKFKVNHKGKAVKVKLLESYIAPQDFKISGQEVKKGSWVLTVRVLDDKIWANVKNGTLTGWSMAGWAKAS